MKWILYFTYYYYYFYFTTINCKPLNSFKKQTYPVTPPALLEFMRKFGYLEPNPSGAEALYRDDAIIDAIKKIQKYGAINQTGILDENTLKLMVSPRCGVPDIIKDNANSSRIKRYVVGSKSWQKRKISYFIANWSPKIGETKIASDMKKAFNTWARYGNIKFKRVYDPSADIIVAFGNGYHGDQYPFDGPGNILAHAFYPYEYDSYGGDIHFDDDENWRENAANLHEGVDFYSVAVHELGHSLGLAHSPIYSSIMFPYYKGPTQANTLDYDDIMAMYKLYIQTILEEDKLVSNIIPYYSDQNEMDDDGITMTESMKSGSTTTLRSINEPITERTFDDNFITIRPTTRQSIYTTYYGDYDTVDYHKKRFGFTTLLPKIIPKIPDICLGHFDAVSVLRGEVFIFKNSYVWRLTDKYRIKQGYPVKIRQIFTQLPTSINNIDAAYERDTDNAIILFIGNQYWVYDGTNFIENSPKSITDFGISPDISKIDAAMIWVKNGKTYLFAGNQFWRYNETMRKMDDHYPMNINKWRGIPIDIDASATMLNGKTYFFKGNLYWLYNNLRVRPERGYPRRASNAWLGCSLRPYVH